MGIAALTACCLAACQSPASSASKVVSHASLADSLGYIGEHLPTAVNNQGQRLDFSALTATLATQRVVFVGEVHDRYDHHLNQLAVLQALHRQHPNMAMGVEWFQQPFQSVLDDYLAGKISESELLQRSGYYERWRYDYRLLRPIMEYAKTHHLPVIALNAPVELTRKVSKGGLAALTPAERAQLPAQINPPDASYRARLEQVFAEHSQDRQQFDNFLLVQRIWDETMAHNIARYLQAHPQQPMVVFSGSGHISHSAGIPQDLARQMPGIKLATVTSSDAEEMQTGVVDYVLLGKALELPPTGKLGVMLDDKGDALTIISLDANSAAGKAGLQQGDRLASVDGTSLRNMADLKLVLAEHQPGDKVSVAVERQGTPALLAYTVVLQ